MEMIKHAITPDELAKQEARDKMFLEGVEMLRPEGNRHDRRKAEKIAELEARLLAAKP